MESGGTRRSTGEEVKGKEANGVGSQQSSTVSENDLSSIITADAHTSAASSRLNGHPHRYKWTRPFRWKTKSGFCACAITFRFHSTTDCCTILLYGLNITHVLHALKFSDLYNLYTEGLQTEWHSGTLNKGE